jgi:hypothetical protein
LLNGVWNIFSLGQISIDPGLDAERAMLLVYQRRRLVDPQPERTIRGLEQLYVCVVTFEAMVVAGGLAPRHRLAGQGLAVVRVRFVPVGEKRRLGDAAS